MGRFKSINVTKGGKCDMNKLDKVSKMNYKQLCEFFDEEQKKGSSRDKQFEKWRRRYSIERVGGSYDYIVRELTYNEKSINNKTSVDYMSTLRENLYKFLVSKEEHVISMPDLALELSLFNENFVNNSRWVVNNLCMNLDINKENFLKYKYEIRKYTYRAIRTVLDELTGKQIVLSYEPVIVLTTDIDNVVDKRTLSKEESNDFLRQRNSLAMEEYGKIFKDLTESETTIIRDKINKIYGCTFHENKLKIYVDKDAVKLYLDNKNKYILSKSDHKLMNESSLLKFLKSSQGELKNIESAKKIKFGNEVIKTKPKQKSKKDKSYGFS